MVIAKRAGYVSRPRSAVQVDALAVRAEDRERFDRAI
jgi:hypothetical protein